MTALVVAMAVVCFVLAVVRPLLAVGLVLVALPAYLVKVTIAGVPVTALEAGIVGTFLGWLLTVVRSSATRHNRLVALRRAVPRSLLVFLALMAVGWLLATAVSIDQRASLGALKAWLIEPLLLGIVVLAEVQRPDDRRFLHGAMLVGLSWVSVAGLVQLVAFRGTVEDARLSSVFAPVANYFAMFAAPLLVVALGLMISGRRSPLMVTGAALGALALLLSFSFGGYLAVGAGVMFLGWRVLEQSRRRRLLSRALVVGALVLVALLPTRYVQEKLNFHTRSSSLVRTQIWRTAWLIGRERPILGIGPNTFEPAYRQNVPRVVFPPLEWLVAKPHSLYLNAWVETGLFGLLGLLGVFGLSIRQSARSASRESLIEAAALVAIMVHGLVDTPVFKNDLAVLTVILVALLLAASRREQVSVE